jgi:hypothetical protein
LEVHGLSPYRLVAYQSAHRVSVTCCAVIGLTLGAAMILGGPGRFTASGFATARVMPGGVYTWGGALALAGSLTLAGIGANWARRVVMAGLLLEGCWYAFFAVSLGIATYEDPHVAVTGPIVYTGAAIWCVIGYDTGRELRR